MMTDKQIIIDGVDVSGCDFLAKKDDYCSYSGITYAYKGQCMFSDEEMCKEHPKCFYKKVLKQLKRKEQECEELKKKIESYNCSTNCYKYKEADQLKATLTEIKEIANSVINGYHFTADIEGHLKELTKQILQKISEVEECR